MEEGELRSVVSALGGVLLNPQEAREERLGVKNRPLPPSAQNSEKETQSTEDR